MQEGDGRAGFGGQGVELGGFTVDESVDFRLFYEGRKCHRKITHKVVRNPLLASGPVHCSLTELPKLIRYEQRVQEVAQDRSDHRSNHDQFGSAKTVPVMKSAHHSALTVLEAGRDLGQQDIAIGEVGVAARHLVELARACRHHVLDANAQVFIPDADGAWFRTGDVAYFDDEGFVFIVDRIKDLIIRGGENIGCGQVEAALLMHPDVQEAAVYAVPDDRLGEEVGATVYGSTTLDVAALREFLTAHLARFELPRYITVADRPLPRTPSGKILKREIKLGALAALVPPPPPAA